MSQQHSFGSIGIEPTPPAPKGAPFWFTARRENFAGTCRAQYADHMRNSYGDRVLPSARFSFDTEVVYAKPKGGAR